MIKPLSKSLLLIFLLSALFLSNHVCPQPVTLHQLNGVRETANAARTIATHANEQATQAHTAADNANTFARTANTNSTNANITAGDAKATANRALSIAQQADQTANDAKQRNVQTKEFVDRFWVLLAAVLVFFMQAGFKCLEVGMSRQKHSAVVGVMNLMNWLVLCIVFYLIGYGLMFGYSPSGSHHGHIGQFIGNLFQWPPSGEKSILYIPRFGQPDAGSQLGLEYFLFQLAFAGTAATIVDGAIAERTNLLAYFGILIGIGIFIYPVFGNWAWNDNGWLNVLHFHDFAGSTVVHSVGAWIALVGVYCVGKRLKRFDKEPDYRLSEIILKVYLVLLTLIPLFFCVPKEEVAKANSGKDSFQPSNIGYAVLGVIMLWFGWWGFNGGSRLAYSSGIANIILHTNLAGASAGIAAYIDALINRDKSNIYPKIIGGVLGGLVAITASCDVVEPGFAILIGVVAGIIHNRAYDLLLIRRLDDAAGAIPVHGACGIWGTLMAGVAISWKDSKHNLNVFVSSVPKQLLVQMYGIVAACVFVSIAAWALFRVADLWIGLRPPADEELR